MMTRGASCDWNERGRIVSPSSRYFRPIFGSSIAFSVLVHLGTQFGVFFCQTGSNACPEHR
jgi:hypothetical protein